MHKTVATNHSSNRYVDESAPGARDGTVLKASDRNAIQGEIVNAIEREQTLQGEATETELQLSHAMGARGFVGDGNSGADYVSAGSGTLTGHMLYDTITISAGDVIDCGGYALRARKKITIEAGAVVHNNGADGALLTPGAAVANSELGGSAAGGAGGQMGNVAGTAGGSVSGGDYGIGGAGGAGGAATAAAGAGGTVTAPVNGMGPWRILPHAATGTMLDVDNGRLIRLYGGAGGGGGGGDTGDAGGGGSGGGVVILIAPIIDNQGEIQAKGGDGGPADVGGDAGGGGGGGGGAIIIITRTESSGTSAGDDTGHIGTLDVSGGAGGGGANSNDGSDGSDGNTCILSL